MRVRARARILLRQHLRDNRRCSGWPPRRPLIVSISPRLLYPGWMNANSPEGLATRPDFAACTLEHRDDRFRLVHVTVLPAEVRRGPEPSSRPVIEAQSRRSRSQRWQPPADDCVYGPRRPARGRARTRRSASMVSRVEASNIRRSPSCLIHRDRRGRRTRGGPPESRRNAPVIENKPGAGRGAELTTSFSVLRTAPLRPRGHSRPRRACRHGQILLRGAEHGRHRLLWSIVTVRIGRSSGGCPRTTRHRPMIEDIPRARRSADVDDLIQRIGVRPPTAG